MPTIYQLKPAFQNLLRPLVRSLAAAGVTANQVTVAAFVLSAATGGALWWQPSSRAVLLAVPVVCFVRMALNAIDGMLAREFAQKSKLGAILNEIGDVLSDAALYLPFASIGAISTPLVVGVVLLAVVSEMTGWSRCRSARRAATTGRPAKVIGHWYSACSVCSAAVGWRWARGQTGCSPLNSRCSHSRSSTAPAARCARRRGDAIRPFDFAGPPLACECCAPANCHYSHDLPWALPILATLNPSPRPIQFPISITQTRRKISAAFWPPNPRLSLMTVFTRALRFTFGT